MSHVANAASKEVDEQTAPVDLDDVSIVEVTDVSSDLAAIHHNAKRPQGPVPVAPDGLAELMSEQSGQRDTFSESPEKVGAEYHNSVSSRTQTGNITTGTSAESASGAVQCATSRPRPATREPSPIVEDLTGPSTIEISEAGMGRTTSDLPREHLQDAEQTAPNGPSAIELVEHEIDTSAANTKDFGPQSISPSSCSETEEQEESEYEEPDSAEVSVDEPDTSVLATRPNSQSRLVPAAPLLDDPRPMVQQHRDPGITRPTSKRQHDSIGVNELLQECHPQAGFRLTQQPSATSVRMMIKDPLRSRLGPSG